MPWTPILPDVDFGLPLLDNLKTLILRDQTPALAWAAAKHPPVSALADFAKVLKCERVAKTWPSLAIYPSDDVPEQRNEGESFDIRVTFGFEVEVTSDKPDLLVEELRKRVAAVRMIVLSGSMEDLMLHVESASKLILEFGPGRYERVRESVETAGLYFRSASFTITFHYIQIGG